MIVVEGEKDADQLTRYGFVATTNVGGASAPWTDDYNETLRDRNVVLLADNDPAGWDRVKNIARDLHNARKPVKIVELPRLPEKCDVSDWLASAGPTKKPKLLELVKKAAAYKPTKQQGTASGEPLGSDPTRQRITQQEEPLSRCALGTVGRFPVEAFPKTLQRYVRAIARAMPCPPDFPGAMMLPVLATFIGRKRCIEIKPGWVEYPLLWVAGVARSGDRKSPPFERVTEPLCKKPNELYAEYLEKKERWEQDESDESGPPPKLVQLLTTDTTIEAMKLILVDNPNGIIYPADELSRWALSMCQYKGGRGDGRQNWLSIWSSSQIVCNRSGHDPIIIDYPLVSVTGGIQPDALGDLVDDAREDGFSARILFSYPDPLPNQD